ncbi:3-oxo-tetronate kinase [Orbus mooreae]|uniref:3-oxo-tetronate kinase n=1 Tax=Orbus mooreae TaxID=3074107 RepID=UPI00370D75F8
MKLGVIADDFTGATDIASFLVNNGMTTIQLNGVPTEEIAEQTDAIVVSLKSRACAPEIAVEQSLAAFKWLKKQGCQRFYIKYCSTFDSTAKGNIGPVTDALLNELEETITIISPALPVNGRTVYQGYLFVMDQLLSDSGMRNHPINPMHDSSLIRLMEQQAQGKCGLVDMATIERGAKAVKDKIAQLKQQGYRYVVLDATKNEHLFIQGEAVKDLKLVTGGSGLAIGLAKQWARNDMNPEKAQSLGRPKGTKCVVLSGSCSVMTNQQVLNYQKIAPSYAIDVEKCIASIDTYSKAIVQWILANSQGKYAPLIYATTNPQELSAIQQKWGLETSSQAVEALFAKIAMQLRQLGYDKFIVAGGETSGIVSNALAVKGFYIGPTIAPGVPWVKGIDSDIYLTLKSGNFGDEYFFVKAQGEF